MGDPVRVLFFLLLTRILLVLAAISLVLFLVRWSSAVRRDTLAIPYGVTLPEAGQVVVPDYAGGGRGQGLVSAKPWKFGLMSDHPIWVALCIVAAVAMAGVFAGCTWYAARLKMPGTS